MREQDQLHYVRSSVQTTLILTTITAAVMLLVGGVNNLQTLENNLVSLH